MTTPTIPPKSYEKHHKCDLIEIGTASFDNGPMMVIKFNCTDTRKESVRIMLKYLKQSIKKKERMRIFIHALSISNPTMEGIQGLLDLGRQLEEEGKQYVSHVMIVCNEMAKIILRGMLMIRKPPTPTTISTDHVQGWNDLAMMP
jgi:hypothetical protein